ncbi:DUF3445 domain-containing protein [Stappia sp. ES.058]|uniref:heme-dependent oxidative N-demethylase family protein n=1 Tax=Stappia sp. ES.058 TaxID=1881061 RepID=UPI00087BE266|nr:DUF3445 domain-containing protein [Stappia sp. ES.058]SDU35661.1 Protein of unknown function [Stappia sp. ES.058]
MPGGMAIRDESVHAPFAHTPYDGSSQPFTVGLMPLDPREWIEPDHRFAEQMAEKDRLFAGAGEAPVFLAEPDTHAAQADVLEMLRSYLPDRFPELYTPTATGLRLTAAGHDIDLDTSGAPPLKTAARLVQEDLVLMRKGDDGYRLAAAALCFPSSWSLAEKFGQSMTGIHETVPGFNGARMGMMVARIFDNLPVDRPSWRLNWSLYSSPELHQPRAKRIDPQASDPTRMDHRTLESGAAEFPLFVRVERQTLRRLPTSGDILFTIKVHHDPVSAFARHPNGADLAEGLRAQLEALNPDQLAYKGLTGARAAIMGLLDDLARIAGRT